MSKQMPYIPGNPYHNIISERVYQDSKWGVQDHSPEKWLAILGEEFGECCKASLEGDCDQYRAELISIAAVAIAAVESYDRAKADRAATDKPLP
jgi:hypothetical protein